MVKEIFLTQNKVAIVDDCDYGYLNQFKWRAMKDLNTFYAGRGIWKDGKRKIFFMHTAILGDRKGLECDHINGNGLDNRRSNLRLITHRQNGQNMHILKTSQYPGVYWDKGCRKWRTGLQVNSRLIHLGYFDNEYKAYLAYRKAVKELTGQECLSLE
jgi:hypothetical protein